jgi:hypothetical protein
MAKKLDRGTIQMTDSYIEISSQNCSLESSLTLFEKDAFTETWKGTFSDGTSFRIVRPNKNLTAIIGDSLTIASMLKDGFAVHFDIR